MLEISFLVEMHKNYGLHFIWDLFIGCIDAPRLLERLSIRIPRNTRLHDNFYAPPTIILETPL